MIDEIELTPDDRDYRPRYPLEKCTDNAILSYHLRDYDNYNAGMVAAPVDSAPYRHYRWIRDVVRERIEGMFYPLCLL